MTMPRRTVVDPRFPARLRQLRTARGLSLRDLARLTYLGKSYLHDFETGRRRPTVDHAARLDDALGAAGELSGMVCDDGPLGYAVSHPHRTSVTAVDILAARLAEARQLEDEVGAAPMLPTVIDHLTTITDMVCQSRSPVRPRLVAVGAQWAQFGGWVHLATGRHRRAGLLLDRALEWATEVGDRDMVSTVLSFKGHAAWIRGQVGPTIGLTQAALRDTTVYVGQRAYDRYQLARGFTAARDRQTAVEELAAGSDLAAEAVEYTGPRPPWHYYRSRAFFMLEAGLVYQLLGENARAVELLRDGLAGLPAEMRQAGWTGMYRAALAKAAACPQVR